MTADEQLEAMLREQRFQEQRDQEARTSWARERPRPNGDTAILGPAAEVPVPPSPPAAITSAPIFTPEQLAHMEALRRQSPLLLPPTPPEPAYGGPPSYGGPPTFAASPGPSGVDQLWQYFQNFIRFSGGPGPGPGPPPQQPPGLQWPPPVAPLPQATATPAFQTPSPAATPPPVAPAFYGHAAPAITLREAERIVLPPFPQHSQYPHWRYAVQAAIVAASNVDCTYFLADLDNPAVPMEALQAADPSLRSLDQKLFAAILHVLRSGEESMRVSEEIKRNTFLGAGRQAIRILDSHFLHQGTRRRQRSLQELVALKLRNISDLEDYVGKFERIIYDLNTTEDKVSDSMACSLLRGQLQSHQKLAPLLAQWEMSGSSTMRPLLDGLKRICIDVRETRVLQQPPRKPGPGKGAPAVTEGDDSGKSKGGKSKGKGKGKDGKKGESDRPKCSVCDRVGHDASVCWRNPASPSYKGKGAEAPKADSATPTAAAAQPPPSTSSPSVSGALSYAAAGSMEQRFQAFVQRRKPPRGLAGVSSLAITGRILDSGASDHLQGDTSDVVSTRASQNPRRIITVNGTVVADREATLQVPSLQEFGTLQALIVQGSPNVLSLGSLVHMGCKFSWEDFTSPTLTTPSGTLLRLDIDNYCPVLCDTGCDLELELLLQNSGSDLELEFVETMAVQLEQEFFEIEAGDMKVIRGCTSVVEPIEDPLPVPKDHDLTHLPACSSCEICRAKMTHSYAKRKADPARGAFPGDLVHLDLVGPTKASTAGNLYVAVIRDDYTSRAWVLPLPNKRPSTMASAWTRAFRPDEVKRIHCDNGGEFLSTFVKMCEARNIQVLRSIPHRSQSNGRAERFNRTLEDGVRCCLRQSGLPYEFWDKAAAHWIVNYNVSSLNERGKAPLEEYNPSSAAMNVHPFGIKVWYIPDAHGREIAKFAPRQRGAILINYAQHASFEVLDYQFYLEGKIRIVITKDVKTAVHKSFPLAELLEEAMMDWQFVLDVTSLPVKCPTCDRWKGKTEITCPGCHDGEPLRYKRTPAKSSQDLACNHWLDMHCQLGRCTCVPNLLEAAQDEVPEEDDTATGVDWVTDVSIHYSPAATDVPDGELLHEAEALEAADLEATAGAAAIVSDFACVCRPISMKSPEASTIAAKAAIQTELDNLVGNGVWKWAEALSRDTAQHIPGACFVRFHMLLGEKNAELGPGRSKYKARGVSLGNMVHDAYGKLVTDPAALAVSQSTAEAEIVAINDTLRNLSINFASLAESIFERVVQSIVYTDAQAAIGAVKHGFGPCRYMRKTQRVSMGWIADALESLNIKELAYVASESNVADAMTKFLQCPLFVEHRTRLQVMPSTSSGCV